MGCVAAAAVVFQLVAYAAGVVKVPSTKPEYSPHAPCTGPRGGCAAYVGCLNSEGCINAAPPASLRCIPVIVTVACEVYVAGAVDPATGRCDFGAGTVPPTPGGATATRVDYTMRGWCLIPVDPEI